MHLRGLPSELVRLESRITGVRVGLFHSGCERDPTLRGGGFEDPNSLGAYPVHGK